MTSMNADRLISELFSSKELADTASEIAKELANRGMRAGQEYPQFVKATSKLEFTRLCTDFHHDVMRILSKNNNLQKLFKADNGQMRLNMLRFSIKDRTDIDAIALNLCASLVQLQNPSLDDHVELLSDRSLLDALGIVPGDNMLVDLNDERLALKHHGIIFDNKFAIYPHQFLRRYYTEHFVDIPDILNYASKTCKVSIRIDPLRKTLMRNYVIDGRFEADAWYGPRFSRELMQDRYKHSRTLHKSYGIVDGHYFAEFTVFRTMMMDSGLREISIEEYCPLETPTGLISPGWGSKYFIQKFGHVIYDQSKDKFTHVDAAVRVFNVDDYSEYFDAIQSNRSNPDHIGVRHKMFLVENNDGIELNLIQALLTAWFRYNPHIQEYFSGTKAENEIPLEVVKAARKGKPPKANNQY